jgi:hypothetical protein
MVESELIASIGATPTARENEIPLEHLEDYDLETKEVEGGEEGFVCKKKEKREGIVNLMGDKYYNEIWVTDLNTKFGVFKRLVAREKTQLSSPNGIPGFFLGDDTFCQIIKPSEEGEDQRPGVQVYSMKESRLLFERKIALPPIYMGRDGTANIQIDDTKVSSIHAKIDLDDNIWSITDWGTTENGSSNGTW